MQPSDDQSRIHVLDRIRARPGGRIALKTGTGILGATLVAVGLVLVPLPGPGWLIVIAGLAVLAVEYAWARHLLRFTRRQLSRWTQWLLRRPWPIRLLVGAAGLVLVSTVVWTSVRLSLGIDLAATAWEHLGT
ncbi:MAG TPA: TIGR02611 family protein [Actinocatenispora sp.]